MSLERDTAQLAEDGLCGRSVEKFRRLTSRRNRKNHQVVRPLHKHTFRGFGGEQPGHRAANGQGGHEAQGGEKGGVNRGAQQQRQVQAAFGARPGATLPAVAARLPTGAQRQALGLASLQRALHLVVRRGNLVEHAQAERERLAHSRVAFPTATRSHVTGVPSASTWLGSSSSSGCTTKSRSRARGCGSVSRSLSVTYSW